MNKSIEFKVRKMIRSILKEEVENNIRFYDTSDSAEKMKSLIKNSSYLNVEVPVNSEDLKIFKTVVGDDGFPKSIFNAAPSNPTKFLFMFHKSEVPELIIKLGELYDETGDDTVLMWKEDIENYKEEN